MHVNPVIRFLVTTTVQITIVVVLFAFMMTVLFEPGEWSKADWFTDLLPLLLTIVMINLGVQLIRLRRRAKRNSDR